MPRTLDKSDADRPAGSAPSVLRQVTWAAAIALLAGAVGFALPHFSSVASSVQRALGSPGPAAAESRARPGEAVFVPFGEVVVNLAEERLTRYLHLNITLLAQSPNDQLVRTALDSRKSMLKDWLISYLSDRSIEEVRGAAGVNRVRREIQDQFNALLFPDGTERIRDVLFEEFTVR